MDTVCTYSHMISDSCSKASSTISIRCFSPAQGTIIVAVLNGEVKQAKVYDTAGALVTSSRSTAGERCQLSVQQPGVYIVKATTKDDKTETFKIVVK